jgi:hypothetical protein
LPQLEKLAEPFGDKPFLLRDLTKQLLSGKYSQEQLDTQIKKAQSDRTDKASKIFGFYIPFLAKELGVFESVGGGLFKNVSLDEEVAEADAVATDEDSDDSGTIYAYSFPTISKQHEAFPIKVGLTTTGNIEARVSHQCKQTCCFEHPVILGSWEVQRVASVESAIHSILDSRGSRRKAPGTEWFDTTIAEIEAIIQFIHSKRAAN